MPCRCRSRSTPSGRWRSSAEDCGLIAPAIVGSRSARSDHRRRAGLGRQGGASARPRGSRSACRQASTSMISSPMWRRRSTPTITTLRELGAKIVKVELPDQTAVAAAALIVLAVEATSCHAPWLRTRAADYAPQVRNRLENGLAYSAVEYLEALRWRGPALAAHLAAHRRRRRRHRAGLARGGAHHRGNRRRRRAGGRGASWSRSCASCGR